MKAARKLISYLLIICLWNSATPATVFGAEKITNKDQVIALFHQMMEKLKTAKTNSDISNEIKKVRDAANQLVAHHKDRETAESIKNYIENRVFKPLYALNAVNARGGNCMSAEQRGKLLSGYADGFSKGLGVEPCRKVSYGAALDGLIANMDKIEGSVDYGTRNLILPDENDPATLANRNKQIDELYDGFVKKFSKNMQDTHDKGYKKPFGSKDKATGRQLEDRIKRANTIVKALLQLKQYQKHDKKLSNSLFFKERDNTPEVMGNRLIDTLSPLLGKVREVEVAEKNLEGIGKRLDTLASTYYGSVTTALSSLRGSHRGVAQAQRYREKRRKIYQTDVQKKYREQLKGISDPQEKLERAIVLDAGDKVGDRVAVQEIGRHSYDRLPKGEREALLEKYKRENRGAGDKYVYQSLYRDLYKTVVKKPGKDSDYSEHYRWLREEWPRLKNDEKYQKEIAEKVVEIKERPPHQKGRKVIDRQLSDSFDEGQHQGLQRNAKYLKDSTESFNHEVEFVKKEIAEAKEQLESSKNMGAQREAIESKIRAYEATLAKVEGRVGDLIDPKKNDPTQKETEANSGEKEKRIFGREVASTQKSYTPADFSKFGSSKAGFELSDKQLGKATDAILHLHKSDIPGLSGDVRKAAKKSMQSYLKKNIDDLFQGKIKGYENFDPKDSKQLNKAFGEIMARAQHEVKIYPTGSKDKKNGIVLNDVHKTLGSHIKGRKNQLKRLLLGELGQPFLGPDMVDLLTKENGKASGAFADLMKNCRPHPEKPDEPIGCKGLQDYLLNNFEENEQNLAEGVEGLEEFKDNLTANGGDSEDRAKKLDKLMNTNFKDMLTYVATEKPEMMNMLCTLMGEKPFNHYWNQAKQWRNTTAYLAVWAATLGTATAFLSAEVGTTLYSVGVAASYAETGIHTAYSLYKAVDYYGKSKSSDRSGDLLEANFSRGFVEEYDPKEVKKYRDKADSYFNKSLMYSAFAALSGAEAIVKVKTFGLAKEEHLAKEVLKEIGKGSGVRVNTGSLVYQSAHDPNIFAVVANAEQAKKAIESAGQAKVAAEAATNAGKTFEASQHMDRYRMLMQGTQAEVRYVSRIELAQLARSEKGIAAAQATAQANKEAAHTLHHTFHHAEQTVDTAGAAAHMLAVGNKGPTRYKGSPTAELTSAWERNLQQHTMQERSDGSFFQGE